MADDPAWDPIVIEQTKMFDPGWSDYATTEPERSPKMSKPHSRNVVARRPRRSHSHTMSKPPTRKVFIRRPRQSHSRTTSKPPKRKVVVRRPRRARSNTSIEQKGGKRSDDATTKLAGPSKIIEQEGGKGSDDAISQCAATPKMIKQEGGKGSDDATSQCAATPKMIEQEGGKGSDDATSQYVVTPKLLWQKRRKGSDISLTEIVKQVWSWSYYETAESETTRKVIGQKEGKGSGDSPLEWSRPLKILISDFSDYGTTEKERKVIEWKRGRGFDDSLAESEKSLLPNSEVYSRSIKISEPTDQELDLQRLRSLLEISEPSDQELDLQRLRSLLEPMEEKGGKRSDDTTAKMAGPSKISEPTELDLLLQRSRSVLEIFDPGLSDNEATEKERAWKVYLNKLMMIKQEGGKGSDDATTQCAGTSKLIWNKGGEGSDDSPPEWARPFQGIEWKRGKEFDDCVTESEVSIIPNSYLYLRRRRACSHKLIEWKAGKGFDDCFAESEISVLPDSELYSRRRSRSRSIKSILQKERKGSDGSSAESEEGIKVFDKSIHNYAGISKASFQISDRKFDDDLAAKQERSPKLIRQEGEKGSDDSTTKYAGTSKLIWQKGKEGSDDSLTEWAKPTESKPTELVGVLRHTRRLTLCDEYSYARIRLKREGKKSGKDTAALRGDGRLLKVDKWMSTDDETHLEVSRNVRPLLDLISILSPLCPAVEHISIDISWINVHKFTEKLMPMRSVITVFIKFLICTETLHETLLAVNKSFPNAESLDLQVEDRSFKSNQAYFPEVNTSSSLRELRLRYDDRVSHDVSTESLFREISTPCPNIVSLVLSGFGRWLSNKSVKYITSFKLPHLTEIHIEPFGTDDCCRFDTLLNVLHVVHVISPRLKLVEAKKVQLGGAEFASVKWSQISSGCELQLNGASVAVPMADLIHLVFNELEGVTVLTFDSCQVDIPQSISHPPQNIGKETSFRELKFINVECPLSQSDIQILVMMYPNVEVKVEHERQASHEDSKQGTGIPFTPERKTFTSSPPSPTSSIEQLQGASSSQTLQAPHRSKGGILDNISGRQEDFDETLIAVAKSVVKHEQMDNLGKVLIFERVHILRYIYIHMKNAEVSCLGTLSMFRDWRNKQTKVIVREALKDVLEEAGQIHLADELFDDRVGPTARVQPHQKQTDTQHTEEEGKEEEEEDCVTMESLPHETVSVKPIEMECCKSVGVEGGKLQLDSFGIELEIPPGAIDSEVPQDISLRVLTDTPIFGNSKEEMSVCFGVQCLSPDDLVLKLPVTYTIPHCAVITRYSRVEAVLYTGEGEYSIDAEVNERIPLSRSGIPNCNIKRDILRLQMNHFSWAFIKFKLKNFFFRGKRMCCLPFAEKPLPEERTHVVLRAHLYDDIKGGKEIASEEERLGFAPIHPQAEVLIGVEVADVIMTCFIRSKPIGDATVKYEELWRGLHRTRFFILDLSSQTDVEVLVTLQVGQTGQSLETLLCKFKFTTPHRSTSVPTQGLEQLQGASSSQTLQAPHQTKGGILDTIPGRREDFDEKLTTVAQRLSKHKEIDKLGKALGFIPDVVQRYIQTNMKTADVTYVGTQSMLRDWRKKLTKATECGALKKALEEADQLHLADELFASPRVQALTEGTDTQNTDEEEKKEEEEEEEEDEYFMAMESLHNEPDELVGATARVQVHEEQTDTQNTEEVKNVKEEEDYISMESLPREPGSFQVGMTTVARELARCDDIDDSGRVWALSQK